MSLSDAVSATVEPINKLIDSVSGAIGKAYEYRYRKRMADAKAYEIRVISEELRNNADLPIVYSPGDYSIDTSDYEALVKRTGMRVAYQELIKQENIETVVDGACELLRDDSECTDESIPREWMSRFIDSVGDIREKDLQILWSKLLAGKVKSPGCYSIRTLDRMRNLEVKDAKLFETLCGFVISNQNSQFVMDDADFLSNHGLPYESILELDECGLINSGITVLNVYMERECGVVFDFDEYVLVGRTEGKHSFQIKQYPLTTAGKEIKSIAGVKREIDSIKELCSIIQRKNSGIELTLHKVTQRKDEMIDYEKEPIQLDS